MQAGSRGHRRALARIVLRILALCKPGTERLRNLLVRCQQQRLRARLLVVQVPIAIHIPKSQTCNTHYSHRRIGDRCTVAAADEAGVIAVFDPTAISDGIPEFCCDAQPHSASVHDMKWACDDSFIASASADGTLSVNSIAESRLVPIVALKKRSGSNREFEPPVKSVACHPSTPGILASGNR